MRGVPETRASGPSASPAGNVPAASDHVYVPVPPVPASVAENGTPTSHGVGSVVSSENGADAVIASGSRTVMVDLFVSLRLSAVTFGATTKSNVPAGVGEPDIRPVAASIASPGGKVPEL